MDSGGIQDSKMGEIVIRITLPEELAEQAKVKGLLSSSAIERYIREELEKMSQTERSDEPFDLRLEGIVNPAVFKKGKITGDIIGPFHDVWGTSE
ncbi:MAG: hypothetical protein LIQ31_10870 [Planctomycetes bacterium]|nr:hypothetical protein [Planctomycetota bacterium]